MPPPACCHLPGVLMGLAFRTVRLVRQQALRIDRYIVSKNFCQPWYTAYHTSGGAAVLATTYCCPAASPDSLWLPAAWLQLTTAWLWCAVWRCVHSVFHVYWDTCTGQAHSAKQASTFEQRQTISHVKKSKGERGTALLWSFLPCLLACCWCSTTTAAVPGFFNSPNASARRLFFLKSSSDWAWRSLFRMCQGKRGRGTRQHEKATPHSSPFQN